MKFPGLLFLLLAGFAASSSEVEDSQSRGFFSLARKRNIYTSKHDIVNIFAPLNGEAIVFDASDSNCMALAARNDLVDKLFFVEGDHKDDGTFENRGLFVLKLATGEATKLLDNGVDITSKDKERKKVYFAATDGIYLYNAVKNTAEKYGSVTDNIISIAQTKSEDVIYALTADKVLYKVTENGEKKEKVDDVKDAQQIMLDNHDNLYFYDSEKRIFIKRFSDPEAPLIQFVNHNRPKNSPPPHKIKLVRPEYDRDGVPVIIDDKVMAANRYGHMSGHPYLDQIASATAQSMEGGVIFYLAYNKTIYEYNFGASLCTSSGEEDNVDDDKKDHAGQTATRLRSALHHAHGHH